MRRSEGPAASGGCGEGGPGARRLHLTPGVVARGRVRAGSRALPSPQGLRFAPGGLLPPLAVGAAHRAEVKLPVRGF